MYKNIHKKASLTSVLLLIFIGMNSMAARTDDSLQTGQAVRSDTSPPLRDMLLNIEKKQSNNTEKNIPTYFEIPNILNIDPSPAEVEFNNNKPVPKGLSGTNGLATPSVDISVDGYNSADNVALVGGNVSPPDTNGDVGIDFYIQYVNLGWVVLNKTDGSVAAGPFIGNN